jgi:hypothetical protein
MIALNSSMRVCGSGWVEPNVRGDHQTEFIRCEFVQPAVRQHHADGSPGTQSAQHHTPPDPMHASHIGTSWNHVLLGQQVVKGLAAKSVHLRGGHEVHSRTARAGHGRARTHATESAATAIAPQLTFGVGLHAHGMEQD